MGIAAVSIVTTCNCWTDRFARTNCTDNFRMKLVKRTVVLFYQVGNAIVVSS
jgi:hypothetical protein